MEFPESVYDDSTEDPEANPKDILNYPYYSQFVFDTSVYDETEEFVENEEDKNASSDVKAM